MTRETKNGDLAFLSVTAAAALLGKHKVSPVELLTAVLARIDQYSGFLKSYITVCAESAFKAARQAERRIMAGKRRGPLDGIPISHKDVSFTKGVRTTAHSRTLLTHVPNQDATHVRRLALAGMVLVGKTNTTEFACGDTEVFGTPRNPWNLSRYAGGSSGGSANAVAAGLALAATGSDTGGSIRVPASFCGIVGVKPTFGLVSRYGVLPLSWSMDTVGPITRRVSDAALLLKAMAGFDALDRSSFRIRVPDYRTLLNRGVRGLIIGVPRQHFFDDLDPEVDRVVKKALTHFEDLGAKLEPVDLPLANKLEAVSTIIMMTEAYGHHAARLKREGHLYSARARRRILLGAFCTAADYQQALLVRTLWIRELERSLQRVAAIVTPTVPYPAFTLEIQSGEPPDAGWATRHFNLSGHPAITIPCGFTMSGLPVGLQIVTRAWEESTLFRIGHAYETTTEWCLMHPGLEVR